MRMISRIIPLAYADEHYFAVNKPPRINLEAATARRGPALIETLRAIYEHDGVPTGDQGLDTSLIPLIVPEKNASGIALFAKHEDAVTQISREAESGRLAYQHVLLVKGAIRSRRIAVRPDQVKANKTSKATSKRKPLAGRFESIRPGDSTHIVRCETHAAALDDLRRIARAAHLTIVGDVERESQTHPERAVRRRRLMTHLESITFEHTLGRRTLTIRTDLPRAFAQYQSTHHTPHEHLQVALAMRIACLLDHDTNCHRLLTASEGISGLSVDRFGDVIVLETLEGKFHGDQQLLRQIGNDYHHILGVDTVVARNVKRKTPTDPKQLVQVVRGKPIDELTITENGARFIITPMSPNLTGLFADHRENRRRVRRMAEGKDVLNLFAYTCGFSVSAALGGAKSTTSVDLTIGHLEWGKRNFAENGIDLDGHLFIRSEAFEYFKRARRQNRQYDLIIIDPPSFARSKKPKKTWEIKRDLSKLIGEALTVMRPGGVMLVSTNNRSLSAGWLVEQVEEASDRPHRILARPSLPVDFAPDPAYQKTIIVQFG